MAPAPANSVDLTHDTAFTLTLLDDTWRWRKRLVEALELGTTDRVPAVSSYQIELPVDLVRPFTDESGPPPDFVRAIVPLTTRPKRPLLGFGVTGPAGATVVLHPRRAIAVVEAEYLLRGIAASPHPHAVDEGLNEDVVRAVCRATYGRFDALVRRFSYVEDAIQHLLRMELGLACDLASIDRWLSRLRPPAQRLAEARRGSVSLSSTSENFLLALAEVEQRPSTTEEITSIVEAYADAVLAADEWVVHVLAEYGQRWEVLVELDAPVGRPFTVKLHEDRRLKLQRRHWVRQRWTAGDAESAHLHLAVRDPSVRITRYRFTTIDRRPIDDIAFQGVRRTDESVAVYDASTSREHVVTVEVQLGSTPELRFVSLLLGALCLTAAATASVLPGGASLAEALGVLTVPTTLAAALVLLRERTSLSERIQRPARLALVVLILVLWAIALGRLIGDA